MTQLVNTHKKKLVVKTRKPNFKNAFKASSKIPVYEVHPIDNELEQLSTKLQQIYDSGIKDKREANVLQMKFPGMTNTEKIENLTLGHIKYKIACTKFQEVVDSRSDFFKARINLSYCLFRLKQYNEALKHCIYLENNTNPNIGDYDSKMAALYDNMGDIYLVQTDIEQKSIGEKNILLEKARKCFSRSLEYGPDNEYVLVTLLMVYCLQGNKNEAKKLLYYSGKEETDFTEKAKKMVCHNPVTKSILKKLYKESDLIRKMIKAEALK